MSAPGSNGRRDRVLERLRELEGEMARLQAEAATHAVRAPLPGAYVVLEANGQHALAPAAQVGEVLRLVETTPLPGAPREVLGTFLHRGRPVVAIDLARAIGADREPRLDAHLVVFATSRPFALVVDRVRAVVERPEVAAGEAPEAWSGTGLVAALCATSDGVVPLLRLTRFTALVEELAG
jgi:purine-binding chemotaxis protein CheW